MLGLNPGWTSSYGGSAKGRDFAAHWIYAQIVAISISELLREDLTGQRFEQFDPEL